MGGSGKTYLSELLAARLGAPVYHLDDHGDDYRPFIGLPKLRELVGAASEEVVIYEGVGVFDDAFDDLEQYRILVQVPDNVRRERATGRDLPRADRSAQDWQDIYDIWIVAEQEYFVPATIDKADLIVGTVDGQFDVDDILARISAS